MLEPVDLVHIGQLKELKELKLKSNSGNLIIDDFSQSLQEFVSFKPNMTNLVKNKLLLIIIFKLFECLIL